jgi:3-deoxy-manno-octulosonate cytidylyltransferase (CMP-KDO synthetase)
MSLPATYGFIPARYASSRFPGKPLADILGKPMFWHVWKRACRCPLLRRVTLCTDDGRIAEQAGALGVPCVMTRQDHASGTDRIYEAALAMKLPEEAVAVNIQGDEPALNPAMLDTLLAPFADSGVRVTTLAHPLSAAEAASPDRVKVVTDLAGNALYFSRGPIPFDRDGRAEEPFPYRLHLGLYAFRMEALAAFTSFAPTRLETREKLEQLRLLEHGIPVRVLETAYRSHGVDSPQDLEFILPLVREALLAEG